MTPFLKSDVEIKNCQRNLRNELATEPYQLPLYHSNYLKVQCITNTGKNAIAEDGADHWFMNTYGSYTYLMDQWFVSVYGSLLYFMDHWLVDLIICSNPEFQKAKGKAKQVISSQPSFSLGITPEINKDSQEVYPFMEKRGKSVSISQRSPYVARSIDINAGVKDDERMMSNGGRVSG